MIYRKKIFTQVDVLADVEEDSWNNVEGKHTVACGDTRECRQGQDANETMKLRTRKTRYT